MNSTYAKVFLVCLSSTLSFACGSTGNAAITGPPSSTPIPQVKRPADFKGFEIGPFRLLAPNDLKEKKVDGEDSEVHKYENREFSIGMDISPLFYGDKFELEERSYQHALGTMLIDGKSVRFMKGDLNQRLPTAARNADGSKSPPVEKNHFITVFIPEAYAVVSVNYKAESSTDRAFAIIQSLRVKASEKIK